MRKYSILLFGLIAFIITLPFLHDYVFCLDLIPRLSHLNTIKLFYGMAVPNYGGNLALI